VYKTIVVGTDGSDRAGVAVKEAFGVAKIAGGKVYAIHAVEPATTTASLRDQADTVRTELLAEAERQGVSVEFQNLEGDPADALIRTAEAVEADLVVVGNRGMTGMKRFVLGSVPNKVSHQCPCNLLIVDTERS
jgi:nucleotide-binding universal stress UspA family protein